MDVPPAGGPARPGVDLLSAPVVASGAGAERSFATVLAEGPTVSASPPPGSGRCPITTPILDLEPVARPARLSLQVVQVVGERAGKPAAVAASASPARSPASWQQLAQNTLAAEARIDAMIEAARRGQSFTPGELIGLQMEVFRYSQTVEVISRTTDKLVGAVKQLLATPV